MSSFYKNRLKDCLCLSQQLLDTPTFSHRSGFEILLRPVSAPWIRQQMLETPSDLIKGAWTLTEKSEGKGEERALDVNTLWTHSRSIATTPRHALHRTRVSLASAVPDVSLNQVAKSYQMLPPSMDQVWRQTMVSEKRVRGIGKPKKKTAPSTSTKKRK